MKFLRKWTTQPEESGGEPIDLRPVIQRFSKNQAVISATRGTMKEVSAPLAPTASVQRSTSAPYTIIPR